jgi:transcriptional regulator with XRE-family HTH domain
VSSLIFTLDGAPRCPGLRLDSIATATRPGYDCIEMGRRFRDRLRQELLQRRERNPRYSLRAFAVFLGSDHSTLSQILRAKRPVPAIQIRRWAKKLGMEPEEAAAYIAAEHLPESSTVERESQLRHWTAEAMAIIASRAHWEILRLLRSDEFQPDCRWISKQIGVTVDEVNVALSRLLRLRLLRMTSNGKWTDTAKPPAATEREFRKLALARIREQAAAFQVKLPAMLRVR